MAASTADIQSAPSTDGAPQQDVGFAAPPVQAPSSSTFDPKSYLDQGASGAQFDPKAYVEGKTVGHAPMTSQEQDDAYGTIRGVSVWEQARYKVGHVMDALSFVHAREETTPGVQMRPIDAFRQVGGDLASMVVNSGPYIAGMESGFAKAAPVVSKWLGRLFVGQMLYGTATSIPKWIPYPEKWPGSSSLGTEWRNEEGGPARTAHAVVDAAQAFVTGLGVLHVAAPRAIESMEHAHIQDVPGKLVDAAGSIADAEKRQSVVEAANHLADSVGMPRTEVKVEPPAPPAPPEITIAEAAKMSPQDFVSHYRDAFKSGSNIGITDDAERLGKMATTPEQIDELKRLRDEARSSTEQSGPEGEHTLALGMKAQFFAEAYDEALKAKPSESVSGQPPTGETPPKGAGQPEEGTYGVAARVTDVRAKAGEIEPVEPGKGISPEASVERGRELLAAGRSPENALKRFEDTGAINADDFSVVRAHGEKLAKAAARAADKFGPNSKQYIEASNEDSAWIKAIKPMQTEWARIGAAQQGETELDTGNFHSLRTEFNKLAGRDFTEREAETANQIAEGVRKSEEEVDTAKTQVIDDLKKKASTKPTGTKIEPGSVADVWKRAKDYLEAGEDDFDDIRTKIAADTGLPVRDVTKMLAGPKKLRVITNEMYSKMSRRRALIAQANSWLKSQAMPGWQKAITGIPGIFFRAKVRFHGTVGMITHAGINIYNPAEWGVYWPKFIQQFSMMGWFDRGAYHEATMQELVRDPNYITARRAGLANDATRGKDDYETAFKAKSKLFHSIDQWGSRGFDTLKTYRQARFNHAWDSAPKSLQTKEYAELLSDAINHSTGYVKASFPKIATSVFFAPKLEGSRWAYALGDPAKAANTFANWSKASEAERSIALREVKEKAMIAGTYIGLLAANQGLLSASGSKQQINYTDPRKPDFLAFKAAGYQFSTVAPMIGSLRYVVNLIHASIEQRSGAELRDSRFDEMMALTGKYVRGKLSPFGGVATDIASQSDFQKRPLPFSSDKVPAYLRREGIGPYTYPEWLTETFVPIPVQDAIKEVWADQGMSQDRISHWLGVLATVAVEGGTGARMKPDIGLQEQPARSKNRDINSHFR